MVFNFLFYQIDFQIPFLPNWFLHFKYCTKKVLKNSKYFGEVFQTSKFPIFHFNKLVSILKNWLPNSIFIKLVSNFTKLVSKFHFYQIGFQFPVLPNWFLNSKDCKKKSSISSMRIFAKKRILKISKLFVFRLNAIWWWIFFNWKIDFGKMGGKARNFLLEN